MTVIVGVALSGPNARRVAEIVAATGVVCVLVEASDGEWADASSEPVTVLACDVGTVPWVAVDYVVWVGTVRAAQESVAAGVPTPDAVVDGKADVVTWRAVLGVLHDGTLDPPHDASLRVQRDEVAQEETANVEVAVVDGLSRGLTNAQLAVEWDCSHAVAKYRVLLACQQLGVTTRAHAVAEAFRRGLLH